MVMALAWTLIALSGLIVALGVLADTLRSYARFRRERPDLARAYWIEVVHDLVITAVQGCFAFLGALYLLNLEREDANLRSVLALMLFAGPVLLMVASLNHYWSRRRL